MEEVMSSMNEMISQKETESLINDVEPPGEVYPPRKFAERDDILGKIKTSEWMNSQKFVVSQLEVDEMGKEDLELLYTIFVAASKVEKEEESPSTFKKMIKGTSLGTAGTGEIHWIAKGSAGVAAHLIYHQLWKKWKKKEKKEKKEKKKKVEDLRRFFGN
jgi:hypothetical protein